LDHGKPSTGGTLGSACRRNQSTFHTSSTDTRRIQRATSPTVTTPSSHTKPNEHPTPNHIPNTGKHPLTSTSDRANQLPYLFTPTTHFSPDHVPDPRTCFTHTTSVGRLNRHRTSTLFLSITPIVRCNFQSTPIVRCNFLSTPIVRRNFLSTPIVR
jgi:hypothetical protein